MVRGLLLLIIHFVLLGSAGCSSLPDSVVAVDSAATGETVDRPNWQAGDRWVFEARAGLTKTRLVTVIKESNETGFTQQYGGLETRYFTPDGELIAKIRDGATFAQFSPPLPLFRFPLRPHMRWYQGDGPHAIGGT